jgi:hypothetical protein
MSLDQNQLNDLNKNLPKSALNFTNQTVSETSQQTMQQILFQKQISQQQISQSTVPFKTYGFSLTGHNIDNSIYSNQNLSTNSMLSIQQKWASMLITYLEDKNENSTLNTELFISCYEEISRETPLSMIGILNNQLSCNNLYKSNCRKLKLLRSQLFVKLLEKFKYSKKFSSIFLKEKSAKEMIEDIHTIASCHTDNSIKSSIFDMFLLNSKDDDCTGIPVDTTIKSTVIQTKQLMETSHLLSENEFQKMSVEFLEMKTSVKELKEQNELILRKLNILLQTDDEYDNREMKRKTYANKSKVNEQSEVLNSDSIQQIAAVTFASVTASTSTSQHTKSSKTANESTRVVDNPILAKNAINTPTSTHTINFKKTKQNHLNSVKQSENNKKQKINCVKVNENGITRLVNSNKANQNSVLHKQKPKNLIIGSAISDVKALRAVSRPFFYYTGQWSPKTTSNDIRDYISKFSKVLNVEELSTHIEQRRHKSFKLTVESFCQEEMMNPSNWPGGIQVTRWRGPPKLQKKPRFDNEETNSTVTLLNINKKAPTYIINNNNKSIIDNQMIESHKNNMSRDQFKKSLQENDNQNKSTNNSILIEENDDEIQVDNENDEEQTNLVLQINNQISSGALNDNLQ